MDTEEFERKISVDPEQMEADKAAISNLLVIIKGVPGSGKTHTAVELIRLLYESNVGNLRILFITQKNISLDSTLLKILEFADSKDVTRHGGEIKINDARLDTIDFHDVKVAKTPTYASKLRDYNFEIRKIMRIYCLMSHIIQAIQIGQKTLKNTANINEFIECFKEYVLSLIHI